MKIIHLDNSDTQDSPENQESQEEQEKPQAPQLIQLVKPLKTVQQPKAIQKAPPFKTLQGKMLRYEGMTCTTNIYRFASWKDSCPAHERWDDVIECQELSASMTVADVLEKLPAVLDVKVVEINMRNNKFIDYIISDHPEKEFEVMVPESKLDNVIKADKEMRLLSYRTLFHKRFYENIDDSFPYQELSLRQIGIPLFDVIQVSTEHGVSYVELSADSKLYE